MPADIRIEIQQDKTMLRTMQHKVVLIALGIVRNRAKHTALSLRING
jgi:hypothetical protein